MIDEISHILSGFIPLVRYFFSTLIFVSRAG